MTRNPHHLAALLTAFLLSVLSNASQAQFIMQNQLGEEVAVLVEFKAVAKDKNGKLTVESLAVKLSSDTKPNSNAAKVELQIGDEVVSLNGKSVKSARDWSKLYETLEDKATMKLVVRREGKKIEFTAVKTPLGSGGRQVVTFSSSTGVSGSVGSTDGATFDKIKISRHLTGVAFDVSENNIKVMMLKLAGSDGDYVLPFKAGDVILGVNGTFVKTFDELDAQLSKTDVGGKLRFAIERNGQRQFVDMNKPPMK